MKPTPETSKEYLDRQIKRKMKETGLSRLKVMAIINKGLKKLAKKDADQNQPDNTI